MPEVGKSEVGKLIGPLLLGAYFNAILYGVLLVQAHSYFTIHRGSCSDKPVIRYLVMFLLLAETVSVWTDFAAVWEPLIAVSGSIRELEFSPIGLRADPIVTSFISTAVQIYMGWRVRKLTASSLLFSIVVFFAFSSLAGAISSTILLTTAPAYSDFNHLDGSIYTWLISSAIAEIIIAVSLVIYLMRNKGNSATTDSVIDRIIRTTVQTGALTSVGAIADLLTFAFFGSTFQFVWDFSLGKLYSISLLSSLNARTKWQNILDREVTAPVIPMDASESGLAPPSRNGYPKHLSPNSFALMSPVLFAAATQLTPPEQSHTVEGRYDYDTVPKSNAGNAFDV